MKFTRFLLAVQAVAMAGCAGVAPSTLKPVREAKSIDLMQPARWKYDSGWGFGHYEYLLVPGSYQATSEDSGGTYYLGPKPTCLFITIVAEPKPPVGHSVECAIFVPNVSSQPARVFVINNGVLLQTEFDADKAPIIHRAGARTESTDVAAGGQAAEIAARAAPNAGVLASGIGAGIGAGIVAAMAEAERGRLIEFNKQPPAGWLQRSSASR